MRILLATNAYHIPRPGGSQEDVYAFAELLQQAGHDLRFLVLDQPKQRPDAIAYVKNRLRMPVDVIDPGTGTLKDWLRSALAEPALFDRGSYFAQRAVESGSYRSLMASFRPEITIGFFSNTWPFLKDARGRAVRTVFRSQDYVPTFQLWENQPTRGKLNPLNWLRRLVKIRVEMLAARFADATASLPLDEEKLYEKWSKRPVFTFTLAYLPDWVKPPTFHDGKRPLDVFYFGASYNIPFHLRGVEFLIDEIAPRVQAAAPGAFRFNVTGAKLPLRLKERCDGEFLAYHDYVPDLQAFLDGMDIGLAPVDTGKSLKGKVFAPLSRGFPMVIAPNCVSLQPLIDGTHVLIAKTAEAYSEALLKLRDDGLRRRIGTAAHAWSRERHSREKLLELLDRVLAAAMKP